MAVNKIGGASVDFYDDTHHAHSFLTHSANLHAAQSYLNQAKEHGQAYIYANNNRYVIKHKKGEDGKDGYSVHYAG